MNHKPSYQINKTSQALSRFVAIQASSLKRIRLAEERAFGPNCPLHPGYPPGKSDQEGGCMSSGQGRCRLACTVTMRCMDGILPNI